MYVIDQNKIEFVKNMIQATKSLFIINLANNQLSRDQECNKQKQLYSSFWFYTLKCHLIIRYL